MDLTSLSLVLQPQGDSPSPSPRPGPTGAGAGSALLSAAQFDAAASGYAHAVEASLAMAAQRRASLRLLLATFPAGSHLLEVGCGVGHEAVALARRGRTVLATDPAPTMVAATVARARAAGVEGRVATRVLAAGDLAALAHAPGPTSFDGAYSSFGALNCEPRLGAAAAALAALLPAGARLVVSAINRWCPFEALWFAAHGDLARATRRLRPFASGPLLPPCALPAPPGGAAALPHLDGPDAPPYVAFRYLTPAGLARAFAPWFAVERQGAFGVLQPPPPLEPLYRRWARLWQALDMVEARLRWSPPWSRLGDHLVLVLRRR